MGVPRLFKLLCERYPLIKKDVDSTVPEIDNLYLDFNGVVHNCTHKDESDAKLTESEMMLKIFEQLEQLVELLRPHKILFISIDGVAPRAKMNQQRQRRFRSAYPRSAAVTKTTDDDSGNNEIGENDKSSEDVVNEAMPDDLMVSTKEFDSNCITPGTRFMDSLDAHLAYFVQHKLTSDGHWKDLEVVVSGHRVPGEGEHKIMEFIRSFKGMEGFNPNTRHCLYGLDADLILLGLATHEPHFCIVREKIVFKSSKKAKGVAMADDRGLAFQRTDEYELLHLGLLREYIEMDLAISTGTAKAATINNALAAESDDAEQLIDDFVCLSFLLGNDFLPHLPTADIDDGGIGGAIISYKRLRALYHLAQQDPELNLPDRCMYLVDAQKGEINLRFLEDLFVQFALLEIKFFSESRDKLEAQEFKKQKSAALADGFMIDEETGEIITVNKPQKPNRPSSIGKQNETNVSVPKPNQVPINPWILQKNVDDRQSEASAHVDTSNSNKEYIKPPDPDDIPMPSAEPDDSTKPSDDKPNKSKSSFSFMHPLEMKHGRALAPQNLTKRIGASVAVKLTKNGVAVDELLPDKTKVAKQPVAVAESIQAADDNRSDVVEDAVSDHVVDAPSVNESSKTDHQKLEPSESNIRGMDDLEFEVNAEEDLPKHMQEPVIDKATYYRHHFNCDSPVEVEKICAAYLLGLKWVTKYYFQGIASWSWYYPLTAAPLASDMKHLENFSLSLELGAPVAPFEQLLSVLPRKSAALLPSALRDLFTSSSISKFYPTKFARVPDSKGREWRELLLIGFVDMEEVSEALASALENKSEDLSDDEKKLNSLEAASIFKRGTQEKTVHPPSTSVGQLSKLKVRCDSKPFSIWPLPESGFVPRPNNGCALAPKSLPAGFPTFSRLSNTRHRVEEVGLIPPGSQRPTEGATLVIDVRQCPTMGTDVHDMDMSNLHSTTEDLTSYMRQIAKTRAAQIARNALGSEVKIGYPFSIPGKVTRVIDEDGDWRVSKKGRVVHEPSDISWKELQEELISKYLTRFGVHVAEIDLVFEVTPVIDLVMTRDGSYTHFTSEATILVPGQLVSPQETVSANDLFKERPAIPVKKLMPVNTKVLILSEQFYGCTGTVKKWAGEPKSKENKSIASVSVESKSKNYSEIEQFSRTLASKTDKVQYKSASVVGSIVGLSPLALSRIVSAVTIDTPSGDRYNVGLGLKFARRGLQISGYARRVQVYYDGKQSDQWQYSDKTMDLLKSFRDAYPDFFRGISINPKADSWNVDEVFIQEDGQSLSGTAANSRLLAVVAWLQLSDHFNEPLMPCDSQALNNCDTLENIVREASRLGSSVKSDVKLDEAAVLGPIGRPLKFESQRPLEIGNRVAYVRDGGSVPFGANGTVVAICRDNVEVLFDNIFLLGTRLNGKCLDARGATISKKWLINLSAKDFFIQKEKMVKKSVGQSSGHTQSKSKRGTNSTANPFALLID